MKGAWFYGQMVDWMMTFTQSFHILPNENEIGLCQSCIRFWCGSFSCHRALRQFRVQSGAIEFPKPSFNPRIEENREDHMMISRFFKWFIEFFCSSRGSFHTGTTMWFVVVLAILYLELSQRGSIDASRCSGMQCKGKPSWQLWQIISFQCLLNSKPYSSKRGVIMRSEGQPFLSPSQWMVNRRGNIEH